MLGFDNIEISMQLLASRKDAVREFSSYLDGGRDELRPAAVNGRSKGNRGEGRYSYWIATSLLKPTAQHR